MFPCQRRIRDAAIVHESGRDGPRSDAVWTMGQHQKFPAAPDLLPGASRPPGWRRITRPMKADAEQKAVVPARRPAPRIEAVLLAAVYVVAAWSWMQPIDLSGRSTAGLLLIWLAIMVRTFSYHVGLGVVLWSVASAIRRRWRTCLAMLPLAAWMAGPGLSTFLPRTAPTAPDDALHLRVVTSNLYWVNDRKPELTDELLAFDADVLCLQEYTTGWHEALAPRLAERYPHVTFSIREDPFAIAIFSRYPFAEPVDQHALGRGDDLPALRAVIDVQGIRTAVYSLHLCPAKLFYFARRQLQQLAALGEALKRESLPAIVAGDFNFTDDAPLGAWVAQFGVTDAYSEAGYSRGDTWPVLADWHRRLPGVRIDHVFLRGGWYCVAAQTGEGSGSDHRPVIADLAFDRAPRR